MLKTMHTRHCHVNNVDLIYSGRIYAYLRELDCRAFRQIADEVGAITVADVSHIGGLIAAGAFANPFDFGFDIVATTTHMTLRGPRGGMIMCKRQYARKIDACVFPDFREDRI
jgi:glycine hydroxymethyltransferase